MLIYRSNPLNSANVPIISNSNIVGGSIQGALQDNADFRRFLNRPWQNLTLANSWVSFAAASFATPQFKKLPTGLVLIKGVLKKQNATITNAENIATGLPISCRPLENFGVPSYWEEYSVNVTKFGFMYVYNTGNLTFQSPTTTNGANYYFTQAQYYTDKETAVFFGDSITFGVGASTTANRWTSLLATAAGINEDNRGISGTVLQNTDTSFTNNGVSRNTTDVLNQFPDKIYCLYGLNDLRSNNASFTISTFQSAYESVIQSWINYGISPSQITIGSPPYMNPSYYNYSSYTGFTAGSTAKHQAYRDVTRILAKKYDVKWVDIYQLMADNGGTSLISPDGVHPADNGHAFIADKMRNYAAFL